MLIVDQAVVDRRLNSPQNLLNSLKVQPMKRGGKTNGSRCLPEPLKIEIGALARSGMTQQDVADLYCVSREEVRDCKKGTSAAQVSGAKSVSDQISDIALNRLMVTLGVIDDTKLKDLNAKDASGVAVNLSRVAANMKPPIDNGGNRTLIVIAPPLVEERKFKRIEV